MTPEQIIKRNRRHTPATHIPPLPPRPDVATAAGLGVGLTWGRQTGRRFGPPPQQAYPQRQTPLTEDARRRRYAPGDAVAEGWASFSPRQARRIRHKANHAAAPFGKRAEG